ncbi:tripartite motif-containing protein, putative [Pediculus humanus corporis]|uniref:Tripartite motif-containing protein, putative n=1 Tax=Pediculus humanus subsp. corporis TaxID=121224 RepID=E0VVI1_PEDHC|nr:tripartite motif-containing protein, putative [Pediculus humanus corporis]EEB17387.1 tripartite motif-containing protein, putative [Pediculus humanus corporis]
MSDKRVKEKNKNFGKPFEKIFCENIEFICQICKNEFLNPRVLPCLHCFCTHCLENLYLEQNFKNDNNDDKKKQNDRFQDFHLLPYRSCSKTHSTIIICPICNFENRIPVKGVQDLPPHYILQHRMLVNSLNRSGICLLCDLCSQETPACCRCTKCLLNLCEDCSKSHKRDKLFFNHNLKYLKKEQAEGFGITKIRRQVMCPSHKEKELKYYCSSCNMVACTECFIQFHSGHNCKSFSRAAQIYINKIENGLENSRILTKEAYATLVQFEKLALEIESKHYKTQKEINDHIDGYMYAFEEHRIELLSQAMQIKNGQLEIVKSKQKEVEKKAKEIDHTIKFGEQLLKEGSDFEVLSFANYLIQRLEWCLKTGTSSLSTAFTSCIGTLKFLPEEKAKIVNNKTIFGVITTEIVSPSNCCLTSEGLEILSKCVENKRCDLTVITKDIFDQRLTHGAEGLEVKLKSQKGQHRQIPIYIVDQQNGIYVISFTPDTHGKMNLAISIRGVPIKGSPFDIHVQKQKISKGNLQCCTFCSSNKEKNIFCKCGSTVTGFHQGCKHGPKINMSDSHWSCCRSTFPKSECLRSFNNDGFYQLKF